MRRFRLQDKLWAITQDNLEVRLQWGTDGRPLQRHDRKFAIASDAATYLEQQIALQLQRGYVEQAPEPPPPPPPPPEPEPPSDERPVERSIRFELAAEERTSYRRYPKPARFLEISQHDRRVIQSQGEIEHPDKAEKDEETYESNASASEAYQEAVETARIDGWRQVRTSTQHVRHTHPELEAQCLAAPDDPAPWAVYADWLIAQGDPLGELAARPSEDEAKELFDEPLRDFSVDPQTIEIERVHGFPRFAEIRATVDEIDDIDPQRIADTTAAVLASTFGRFIDSLRFGLAGYTDRNDWAPTLRAIVESPNAARIRELRFDAYEYTDCEISWATFGNFTGLLEQLPALELLHIKSGAGGTLGELALPSLRRFIRESGGLAAAEIEAIRNAQWPKLEELEIWFGSSNYGAESTVASIHWLLDGKKLPRLRHLGIINCEWVEDAVGALAGSALLPQLHSLDLSKGILARRGLRLFLEHAAAFRHLASLDLSQNMLEPDEAAEIRAVLDNVILNDQREREDYDDEAQDEDEPGGQITRYVAVGE